MFNGNVYKSATLILKNEFVPKIYQKLIFSSIKFQKFHKNQDNARDI